MQRYVTPGQRRALNLRDIRGAVPACRSTPSHCDTHDVVHWADGGDTSLANMTLLCGRHHRLIHNSAWEIRMAPDGRPDFIPPDYLDPLRRPRHNTPIPAMN
jgi:hypothetical protein